MASRAAAFFNKAEARDKFSKSVQYLSRLMMFATVNLNPDISKRFELLFKGMADARKLFRLFKWVNEYQKTMEFLDQPPADWDEKDLILNILARVSFSVYWIFDNLFILSKLKVIRQNTDGFRVASAFFWWLGLLFNLVIAFLKLSTLKIEENSLIKLSEQNPEKSGALKDRFSLIKKIRNTQYRAIIKSLGDLITSAAGWGIGEQFGMHFNDAHIGIGGSVSALITCWELYPEAQK